MTIHSKPFIPTLSAVLILCALLTAAAATASTPPLGLDENQLRVEAERAQAVVFELETVRITSRTLGDGRIRSEIRQRDGRLLARAIGRPDGAMRIKVTGTEAGSRGRSLRLRREDGPSRLGSLTWSNLQLMSWWLDYRSLAAEHGGRRLSRELRRTAVVDGLVRPESLAATSDGPATSRPERLAARLTRVVHYHDDSVAVSERRTGGFDATLALRSDGEIVGQLHWDQRREALRWSIGQEVGEQASEVTPDLLPDGNWPFRPSLSWANLQLLELWRNAPLPFKDTPGCTGLHFLDGTQLRECCDDHDLCYAAHSRWTGAACTAMSWFWPLVQNPGSTWRCQQCNIEVVFCFARRIIFYRQVSWSPQPYCYLTIPGICPVECSGCEVCNDPWNCPP